jgi:glycosyltransferase involved in cell wall biosynthesis
VKVLHVSHTATISGAEHSLLTLLGGMPHAVELGVACPDGPLAAAVRSLGLPVHCISGLSASFRLHPVRTARATTELAAAAVAVRRVASREGATVLHANSVRAGLITGLARMGSGPPAVVHVRDVLPESSTARTIKRVVTRCSAAQIAISEYVKRQWESGNHESAMPVIDNPVDHRRFAPELYDRRACRQALGEEPGTQLIGLVGQITPWKGHDTAIRAIRRVRERHPNAKLMIVGDVKFGGPATSLDNHAFLAGLHDLVRTSSLTKAVMFLGERDDIPQVMRALDILLVPSTAEPFGRTVAEAMSMATPVIATSEGGPAELLEPGVTGLLVAPGNEQAWATAIDRLLSDPPAGEHMASAAREAALTRFGMARHVRSMLSVLESAEARPR